MVMLKQVKYETRLNRFARDRIKESNNYANARAVQMLWFP